MGRKLFGTDGVRGVANEDLTPELAMSLGRAAGAWLDTSGAFRRVCLGRDTRKSGEMLECALAAGLASAGIEVVRLGIAPTPGVAYVARTQPFDLGGIISASHNPAPDNGIKFVTHDGRKTSDAVEEQLENLMSALPAQRPTGPSVGAVSVDTGALRAYAKMLVEIVPEGLSGMKVAVDAANGAAFELGPAVLAELGAEVVAIGVDPDGSNINAVGGATKPRTIQDFTVESGADIGVAFDGDADRAVFSDEKGQLINGDRTIGLWAAHQQARGNLSPAVVVGTVMSNGGFEAYLDSLQIQLSRTQVGDKYVSQRIEQLGAHIGGEQSGHIVFPAHGPTGDGLVTMLEVLKVLKEQARPASCFVADYAPWPQILVNVKVRSSEGWRESPLVAKALAEGEERMCGHGRIVVRPSGTQPMIRVMVEADEYELRDQVADSIVAAMKAELGGEVHGRVDLTHALGD